LDIFDGKLSLEEMINMQLSLLTELQANKEEMLDKQAKEIKSRENKRSAPQQMVVTNTGERYAAK
jgi:hypothetical protein